MPRIFVAGGHGFLGQHIYNVLQPNSDREMLSRASDYCFPANAETMLYEVKPEIVINAAGRLGGIIENRDNPAEFYLENLKIGTYLMESSWRFGINKFVQVGTVCSYPKYGDLPMREENFWNGYPEETNAAYGLAKRSLVAQAQAFSKQYGFNVISPILANLYGPGDHYEPRRSHVIPAMIVKFLDAIDNHTDVELWGTGKASREFLYVEDAANAVKFLLENYDSPEIINVSSGYEIIMKELAEIIAMMTGFRGNINWDGSKPDGQPRRSIDTTRLSKMGWNAKTKLAEGLIKSIEDCREWRKRAKA